VSILIYSMSVSLDGYVETAAGSLDFVHVDDELHAFFNDEARPLSAMLHGRRMYELMAGYWPTADQDPSAGDVYRDFSRIWREKPKVVFSKTLDHVDWNSRLVRDDPVAEVRRLKDAGFDMDVGGPTLAAPLIRADLVDEYRMFVNPVILGAGRPYFPRLDHRLELRLLETRTFGGGVLYLRYERVR
jgi:dihydrofolate reductase